VGDIHLANILGSVLGTVTISFVFLPLFGTELTLKILLLLGFAFLFLTPNAWKPVVAKPHVIARSDATKQSYLFIRRLLRFVPKGRGQARNDIIWIPALLLVMILILPWKGQFYKTLYEKATGQSAIVTESGDTVLALNVNPANQSATWLWIGGVQNSYFPSDGRYERSALTCAAASQPKRILVVGLGGGHTAYFMSQLPNVEEIVIVELMEELGVLLEEHVDIDRALFADPRVHYIVDDGRRYLYANPGETFDLISIDPLNSFTAGHNNLYSIEAMKLYQSHLTEKGVLCGWVNEEHILPNTAAQVFPHVEHFREFIVAGNQPIEYDRVYMENAAENYLSAEGVIPAYIADTLTPAKILHRHLRHREGILEQEKDAPVLTDMTPWLEYYLLRAPITAIIAK
jgi:hypothetical protein